MDKFYVEIPVECPRCELSTPIEFEFNGGGTKGTDYYGEDIKLETRECQHCEEKFKYDATMSIDVSASEVK